MCQKLFNDVYREYINGQSVAMRIVREKYKSNAEFGRFLDEVRSPLSFLPQQRRANHGRSAKRILDVAMRVSLPSCTCQSSAFRGTACSSGYGSIQYSQVRDFSVQALISSPHQDFCGCLCEDSPQLVSGKKAAQGLETLTADLDASKEAIDRFRALCKGTAMLFASTPSSNVFCKLKN